MQDLISIVDTLLMVSGTALAIALTIAPLAYAFIKSGQTEAPVQVTVQRSKVLHLQQSMGRMRMRRYLMPLLLCLLLQAKK